VFINRMSGLQFHWTEESCLLLILGRVGTSALSVPKKNEAL
jgi:hypothetical protein